MDEPKKLAEACKGLILKNDIGTVGMEFEDLRSWLKSWFKKKLGEINNEIEKITKIPTPSTSEEYKFWHEEHKRMFRLSERYLVLIELYKQMTGEDIGG